jgi:GNAT superfamily N-acetyltransferase
MSQLVAPSVASLERVEALTCQDHFAAAPPDLRQELGIGTRWVGSTLVVRCSPDIVALNRAIGIGTLGAAHEGDIEAIARELDRGGSPRTCIQIVPDAEPAALPRWLEARGFAPHNRWVRMLRAVERLPEPPPNVGVDMIGPDRADVFAEIVNEAFGFPPAYAPWAAALVGRPAWRHYVASVDGQALGGAAMMLHGDIAHFGFAGTRATARGHGAQSALIARRLADAAAMGCRWAVLETNEDTGQKPSPSFRNTRRLGFEPLYLRTNYVRPRATA